MKLDFLLSFVLSYVKLSNHFSLTPSLLLVFVPLFFRQVFLYLFVADCVISGHIIWRNVKSRLLPLIVDTQSLSYFISVVLPAKIHCSSLLINERVVCLCYSLKHSLASSFFLRTDVRGVLVWVEATRYPVIRLLNFCISRVL